MRYKMSAMCFAILGIASIPLSGLLFPLVQRMSAHRLPDGTLAVLSPSAGTWIFKVGFAATGVFLALAVVMFWLSAKRKPDEKRLA